MAAVKIDFKLKGFSRVTRAFNKLDGKLKKKHLRPALRAGAKVIKNAAQSLAPKDKGKLKSTMKIRALKRSRKNFGVFIRTGTATELGIPNTPGRGYYPFTVEYGTDTQPAKPYMRPALMNNDERARKAVADRIWRGIKAEARKN